MSDYQRYAIYWLPDGALRQWGEAWLGWDMTAGRALPRPAVVGLPRPLADLTRTATSYGLHATIKSPFRLADGMRQRDIENALAVFCRGEAAAVATGLALTSMDGFLALTLDGDTDAVDAVAARAVAAFDPFRAPAPVEEIDRRRAAGLSPRQDAHLLRWGYPYVMEDFRFHVTLTDRLTEADAAQVSDIIGPQLDAVLTRPFILGGLALVGQTQGGFRLIAHHAFSA